MLEEQYHINFARNMMIVKIIKMREIL